MRVALLQNNEVVDIIDSTDLELAMLAQAYQCAIDINGDAVELGWILENNELRPNT